MENRQPTPGMEGRVLITPEGGGTPFYARMTMADNPLVEGTPWAKESIWPDDVAAALGLDARSLPKDGFERCSRGLSKKEIFRTATSTEWTVPDGVVEIDIYIVGAGQGGSFGGNYHNSGVYGGHGGVARLIKNLAVTPGEKHQIEIGAGGSGAGYTDKYLPGNAGGDTSFDEYVAEGATSSVYGSGSTTLDGYLAGTGFSVPNNIDTFSPVNPYDGNVYGCSGGGAELNVRAGIGGGRTSSDGEALPGSGGGGVFNTSRSGGDGGDGGGGGGACLRVSSGSKAGD